MKAFFVIFAIVTIIQLSLAAPLVRSKRDNAVDFGESTYKFILNAALQTVAASQYALEKMPKTEAYAPYRKTLEDFLAEVNAGKAVKGNCFEKASKTFEKFEDLVEHYDDEDAPEEAKEVQKLLQETVNEEMNNSFKEMFLNMFKLMLDDDDEADETKRSEFEKLAEQEC